MTYFGFLARFLVVPIVVLLAMTLRDRRQGREMRPWLAGRSLWLVLGVHIALAVVWTTPWDNYLVATRVWWYSPERVTGLTLGWVPIEEYAFFVLQTIMTSLWIFWLGRRVEPVGPALDRPGLRWGAVGVVMSLWLAAAAILVAGWQPGTYLALTLIWLLPPVIPQLAVGAHILWHGRRLTIPALLVPILYLSVADFLAIGNGVWTISPEQTTALLIGAVLPIEEFVFFALTNILIVFGVTLMLAIDVKKLKRRVLPRRGQMEGGYREV